jgi:hypothetical protein
MSCTAKEHSAVRNHRKTKSGCIGPRGRCVIIVGWPLLGMIKENQDFENMRVSQLRQVQTLCTHSRPYLPPSRLVNTTTCS